jgi:hypothetical protein
MTIQLTDRGRVAAETIIASTVAIDDELARVLSPDQLAASGPGWRRWARLRSG